MHSIFKPYCLLGFVIFLGVVTSGSAQLILSEKATVSVVTFGPYQGELWSAFGHSGIRVHDPAIQLDWIYDYGRFDFEQENFYWNFATGKTMYSIGRTRDFQWYKDLYIAEDRYVYEQKLNLTHQEVQQFFDFLENNYLPENREYLYNYVYDNCASKIRDVVIAVVPYEITFDYGYVEEGKTIRDLMDDYLGYQPWGDFVIDLGLGLQIDKEATGSEYMFLPDFIFTALDHAIINREDGEVPLVARTIIHYETKNPPDEVGLFTPLNTFILLFFIVGLITNRNFKTGRRSHWLDVFLFSIVGLFGWWFAFLWFGTEHLSKYNWNLLWAIPFHLPLVFFLKRSSWHYWLARLYRFLAILHVLTLIFWFLIPQPLHQALVPLLITLILRSFYISYDLSRYKTIHTVVS